MRRTLLSLWLFVPSGVLAQVAEIRLPARTARLAVAFTDVTSLRELKDGRVLLYDRRENQLSVVDFRTGDRTAIGRTGQGPGEFQFIATLLPLGGDSTLAADFRRWLILDGDKVVATLPPDTPAIRAIGLWPLGADRLGRVLGQQFDRRSDSTRLLLIDRATGRAEPIATLRRSIRRAPVGRVTVPDGNAGMRLGRVPLDVREAPALFADGWVAVARLDPYRVDWRAPDGQWVRGAPLPFRAIRVTEEERQAYVARHVGFRNATDWPATLPPFDMPTQLLTTPEGLLAIRRVPSASQPETRYDVVDRTGAVQGQLILPANQRIIGFGAASVYVIETEADGIQRLQRHGWAETPLSGEFSRLGPPAY